MKPASASLHCAKIFYENGRTSAGAITVGGMTVFRGKVGEKCGDDSD